MNFCKLRLTRQIRDEMVTRIQAGTNPDDAADAALSVVQSKFLADGHTTIDWTTLLPEIIQFITLLLALFNPPVPPVPPSGR